MTVSASGETRKRSTVTMSSAGVSWLVALAIATPHFLYAYIWFFPQKWLEAFKGRSVDVFHHAAWALKGARLRVTRPVSQSPASQRHFRS